MSKGYPLVRLADIASDIRYGYTASSSQEPIGPKFLRITDVAQERLNWDDVPYCPISHADAMKYGLSRGDIVIARTGATVGHSKVIGDAPEAVYASYLVRVRIMPEQDALYVGYVIGSSDYKQWVLANAGGAAQPNANAKVLTSYPLPLPPLGIQRKIASILYAYDELIENNNRRIKILEETAQRIYHEWFVDFRYPGHEGVPMVDSELGQIPRDWRASTVGDLAANFDRLRKPLSGLERSRRTGPYPYFGAAKIFDFIDGYLFDGTYLLVAEDGSVITPEGFPVLQFFKGKFWANNHTHVLQGRAVSTEYLYLVLQNQAISGYMTGAAQPKVTQANLNRIPCVAPCRSVSIAFDEYVQPIFSLIQVLEKASAHLGAARDLLLPRLISREIDVDDLDVKASEAA